MAQLGKAGILTMRDRKQLGGDSLIFIDILMILWMPTALVVIMSCLS